MHTANDNVEIMIGNETDKIIEERSGSFWQKYQGGLEKSMKGSEFVFAVLIYYITSFIK